MTTDPRVIECAKAMWLDDEAFDPWVSEQRRHLPKRTWDNTEECERESYVRKARACILKWLAQEPSAKAYEIGFEIEEKNYEMHHPQEDGCVGRAYIAMCAQAAKEISGE